MKMTPLHLMLLLHYTVRYDEWPDIESKTNREYLDNLADEGLLDRVQGQIIRRSYRPTDKGKAHVEALCRLPIPVAKWITPGCDDV